MQYQPAPTLILVRPQMGENIGAAARVAKNFGLSDLRLVAPRDGWPNSKAYDMSAGAKDVIERAQVFDTTQQAIADLQLVWATTARTREMDKPLLPARDAASDMAAQTAVGLRCGVMFGPERSGLENEDIALCNHAVTIPIHPDYPSLNLSQAVGVVCYEWLVASQSGAACNADTAPVTLADKAELHGLFDHLEAELDARNFWKVQEKKPNMWRNIRNMFQRTHLSAQDIRTFRGIIRCLSEFERR